MSALNIYDLYTENLLKLAYEARGLGVFTGELAALIGALYSNDRQGSYSLRPVNDAEARQYAQSFHQYMNYTIYRFKLPHITPTSDNVLRRDINDIGLNPNNLSATREVFSNFLFYIVSSGLSSEDRTISGRQAGILPIDLLFRANISSYLSGLSSEDLLTLLGTKYLGAMDQGSLLFAAITGYSSRISRISNINNIINSPRYELVKRYSPQQTDLIVNELYSSVYYDHYIDIPFRIFLAVHTPSMIEKIIIAMDNIDISILSDKYGLVIPPDTPQRHIVGFFQVNIIYYEPILSRPSNFPQPLPLFQVSLDYIANTLPMYTPKELIQAYNLEIPQYYTLSELQEEIVALVTQSR